MGKLSIVFGIALVVYLSIAVGRFIGFGIALVIIVCYCVSLEARERLLDIKKFKTWYGAWELNEDAIVSLIIDVALVVLLTQPLTLLISPDALGPPMGKFPDFLFRIAFLILWLAYWPALVIGAVAASGFLALVFEKYRPHLAYLWSPAKRLADALADRQSATKDYHMSHCFLCNTKIDISKERYYYCNNDYRHKEPPWFIPGRICVCLPCAKTECQNVYDTGDLHKCCPICVTLGYASKQYTAMNIGNYSD